MKLVFERVVVTLNRGNGISVLGFWKGCIEIRRADIISNLEHGIFAASEVSPLLQNEDIEVLSRY